MFTDGACDVLEGMRVASLAFVVLERQDAVFQFVGARNGKVLIDEEHPWHIGSVSVTNNTGEIEAIGHALAWFTVLAKFEGELLLVSDSSFALAACQTFGQSV